MQIGMIGLGRMGSNMVRRLMRAGHACVVFNKSPAKIQTLVDEGATGATLLADFVALLTPPRVIWVMVPAAAVDDLLAALAPLVAPGDILIDGGNSYYKDDIRRHREWLERDVHYLDVGTSGGVWGLDRGYCLMIGGDADPVQRLTPIFQTLAPGLSPAGCPVSRTPGRVGNPAAEEQGFLHCGPSGAGHFVKMVHNGIEYGLMAAYAEGFNLLRHANIGAEDHARDAETTPLREPEAYRYQIPVAEVAELWRRGSVVASWLLDLTATALHQDPALGNFGGRVSDSGEGRWTSIAAIESGTPAPVLTTALFSRFSSRGESGYGDRLLSAMRYQFGGHHEKPKE
ncbi:6-phosphogluconate dehydrogenase, NAD(+)-dependent, decarboxylating [Gammaproteobacteria bacterium]